MAWVTNTFAPTIAIDPVAIMLNRIVLNFIIAITGIIAIIAIVIVNAVNHQVSLSLRSAPTTRQNITISTNTDNQPEAETGKAIPCLLTPVKEEKTIITMSSECNIILVKPSVNRKV